MDTYIQNLIDSIHKKYTDELIHEYGIRKNEAGDYYIGNKEREFNNVSQEELRKLIERNSKVIEEKATPDLQTLALLNNYEFSFKDATTSVYAPSKSNILKHDAQLHPWNSPTRRRSEQQRQVEAFAKVKAEDIAKAVSKGRAITLERQTVQPGVVQKQSNASLRRGITNILKHDGIMLAYDLETLGGYSALGHAGSAPITEFAAALMQGRLGDPTQTKTLKEYGSIIGISQEQAIELRRLNAIYMDPKRRMQLSPDELVSLKRLTLIGHSKTVIDWDAADTATGVLKYKSFAEVTDLDGQEIHTNLVEKGIATMERIGNYQATAPLVTYNGVQMRGVEAELFRILDEVRVNDYSMVGHNITAFDNPVLQRSISQIISSEGGKSYLAKYFGKGFAPRHMVDTLQLVHSVSGNNAMTYYENELQRVGVENPKIVAQNLFKMNREHGTTGFQQESILRMRQAQFGDNVVFGEKHMAMADTRMLGLILYGSDKDIANQLTSNGSISTGDVVTFHTSPNMQTFGITGFTEDSISGVYRTTDGLRIGSDGVLVRVDDYSQWGATRRGTYSLQLSRIKDNTKLASAIRNSSGVTNVSNDLVVLTATPYASGTGRKVTSPIHMIGTMDQIEAMLNSTAMPSGRLTATGSLDMSGLSGEERANLSIVTVAQDGTHSMRSATPDDILRMSTQALTNESAARKTREFNFIADSRLAQVHTDVEEQVRAIMKVNPHMTAKDARAKAVASIIEQTKAGYAYVNRGEQIPQSIYDTSMFKYFGPTMLEEQVDNTLNRLPFFRKNYAYYQKMLQSVHDKYPTNPEAAQYMYSHIMKEISRTAEVKNGRAAAGYQTTGLMLGEINKGFQIDLDGFNSIISGKDSLLNINNIESPTGIVNSVLRKLDMDVADTSVSTKLGVAKQFQNFIADKYSISDFDSITENDTPESAGLKLQQMFTSLRANDPFVGLRPTEVHTVVDAANDFSLSDDVVDQIINKNKNTTIYRYSYKQSKQAAEVQQDHFVDEIMDSHVLKNIPNETELRASGMSEDDIARMKERIRIASEDARKFASSYIDTVAKTNGTLRLDNGTGRLFYGNGTQETEIFLPKLSYENDGLFFKVGAKQSRYTANIGMHVSSREIDGHTVYNVTTQSMLGKAYDESMDSFRRRALYAFNNGEDPYDIISKIPGSVTLQENTVYGNTGNQLETRISREVQIRELPEAMKTLRYSEFARSLTNTDSKEARTLSKYINMEDAAPLYGELSAEEQDIFQQYYDDILDALDASNPEFDASLYRKSAITNKGINKGRVQVDDDTSAMFENIGGQKRNMPEHFQRNKLLDVTKANDYVSFDEPVITTPGELANEITMSERTGRNLVNSLTTTTMNVDATDFKEIINYGAEQGLLTPEDVAKLELASTADGASFARPEVMESLGRNYVQTVGMANLSEESLSNPELFNGMMPIIKQSENGAFTYQSGAGRIFAKGHTGFTKRGIDGKNPAVSLRETSIGRMVFAINGVAMTDDKINEILLQGTTQAELAAASPMDQMRIVEERLAQYGARKTLVFDQTNVPTNIKRLASVGEKNSTGTLANAMGTYDAKIAKTLTDMGADTVIGTTPKREIIDSLTTNQDLFINYVNTINREAGRRTRLTRTMLKKALKDNGLTPQGFVNALQKERMATANALQATLEALGVSSKIGIFSNNTRGVNKHADVRGYVSTLVNEALKRGASVEQVQSILSVGMDSVSIKNNRIVIGQTDRVNINAIIAQGRKLLGDDLWKGTVAELQVGDGKTITAGITREQASNMANYDFVNTKDINVSTRDAFIRRRYYDSAAIDDLKRILQEDYGTDSNLFNDYFEGLAEGDVLSTMSENQYRQARYYRNGEDRIYSNYSGIDISKEQERAYKKLEAKGISKQQADTIADTLRRKGIDQVSDRAIIDAYTSQSAIAAHQFGAGKLTVDQMKQRGFEVVKLSDLDATANQLVDDPHSFANRNILIDLQDDTFGGQLYGNQESKRYLPVSYSGNETELVYKDPATGNEQVSTMRSERQEIVSRLQRHLDKAKEYNAAEDTDRTSEALGHAREAVNDMRKNTSFHATSNSGIVATAGKSHLQGSSYQIHLLDVSGDEQHLGKYKINGIKLVQGADKKRELNFGIVSTDMLDRHLDTVFESMSDSNPELANQLKTIIRTGAENGEAFLVNKARYPINYQANGVAALVFDKHQQRGIMHVSSNAANMQHADSDGDVMNIVMTTQKAKILHNGIAEEVAIDATSYRLLKEQGVNISWSNQDGQDNVRREMAALLQDKLVSEKSKVPSEILPVDYDMSQMTGKTAEMQFTSGLLISNNTRYTSQESKALASQFSILKSHLDQIEGFDGNFNINSLAHRDAAKAYIDSMKHIETLSANDAMKAMEYQFVQEAQHTAYNVASSKQNAGIMDWLLQGNILTMSRQNGNYSAAELKDLEAIRVALAETTLSAKNATGEEGMSAILSGTINMMKRAIVTEADNPLREQTYNKAKANFSAMLDSVDTDEFRKVTTMDVDLERFDSDQVYRKQVTDHYADLMARPVLDVRMTQEQINNATKAYGSRNGLKEEEALVSLPNNGADLTNEYLGDLNDISVATTGTPLVEEQQAESLLSKEQTKAKSSKISEDVVDAIYREHHQLETPDLQDVTLNNKKMRQATKRITKSSVLAGTAIGLMVAGYANNIGKHAAGTTQLAQDSMASQEQMNAQPVLYDPGLPTVSPGLNAQQGYLINISASSPKGKTAASNAIQAAGTTVLPGQSNISIAINNTNASVMSNRELNQLILQSLSQ